MGQVIDTQLFKVGDIVCYISNRHGDYASNPLWGGSMGKISGHITRIRSVQGLPIDVLWDNGLSNTYTNNDLVHLQTDWDL
jgi:hypothetical protein